MRIPALIFLALSLVPLALGQNAVLDGGYRPMNENDDFIEEVANAMLTTMDAMDGSPMETCMSDPNCTPVLVDIVEAESQIVAGTNFRIEMVIGQSCGADEVDETFTCNVKAFQPLPFDCDGTVDECLEIDLAETECFCNAGVRESKKENDQIVGGYHEMDENGELASEVSNAMLTAMGTMDGSPLESCMSDSNCTPVLVDIVEVESQVVAGTNFRIEMVIGQSCGADEVDETFTCKVKAFQPLPHVCDGTLEECLEIDLAETECFCRAEVRELKKDDDDQVMGGYHQMDEDGELASEVSNAMLTTMGAMDGSPLDSCMSDSNCTPVVVDIVDAQYQVVAGTNFRIEMVVGQSCGADEIKETFTCNVQAHLPLPHVCDPRSEDCLQIYPEKTTCDCGL